MNQQGGMTTAGGQPMRGMQTAQDAQMAVKELREKLQWMPSKNVKLHNLLFLSIHRACYSQSCFLCWLYL